jgi:hypothetical protein
MSDGKTKLEGLGLSQGMALSSLDEGTTLLGYTQGEPLILVCSGELFAIGAACTHYGGPLAEGAVNAVSASELALARAIRRHNNHRVVSGQAKARLHRTKVKMGDRDAGAQWLLDLHAAAAGESEHGFVFG